MKNNDTGGDDPGRTVRVEFGAAVRGHRQRLGLTQEALAERLRRHGFPMTQTMVAKVERGARPTPVEEAVVFAQVLGVPAAALLGDEDVEPDPIVPLLDAVAEVHRRQAGLIAAADDLVRSREQLDGFPADVVDRLPQFHAARLEQARMSPEDVLALRAGWRDAGYGRRDGS